MSIKKSYLLIELNTKNYNRQVNLHCNLKKNDMMTVNSKISLDNNEFIKIKKQIENSFSIESEKTIIYSCGDEHIICLENKWFAMLQIDLKFDKYNIGNLPHRDYLTKSLKALYKIPKEPQFLKIFKKNKEINVILENNKSILYCNYSQIIKMLN
jgi:hypothetical protein